MATRLGEEIAQGKPFRCLQQEAYLSLARTAAVLDHALSEALKEFDITPTQYNVLRILRGAGEEGLCRNEVSARMVARVPDATRLLDRMEAAELIQRSRSTGDRRFVNTRITERGLALVAAVEEPIDALHREHFAGFSDDELRQLIDLLGRARDRVCR